MPIHVYVGDRDVCYQPGSGVNGWCATAGNRLKGNVPRLTLLFRMRAAHTVGCLLWYVALSKRIQKSLALGLDAKNGTICPSLQPIRTLTFVR